jgi:putative OPT family oligopeptide transporter
MSFYLFFGGALGWLIIMPLIYIIGSNSSEIYFPATAPIAQLDSYGLWNAFIRYIGAGMVACGGVLAILKTIPLMFSDFKSYSLKSKGTATTERTDRDLPMTFIIIGTVTIILALGLLPFIPVGLFGALAILIIGLFFSGVTTRIVGIIGSSNSPISGMTIASLVITALIFKLTGNDGTKGMIATITVGSVICVCTAVVGDISQDLKTGFLLGATPRNQQLGEIVGVVFCSLVIGAILILLQKAWGFGSSHLPAPQATLMKMVVEGVMGETFPKSLALAGVALGLFLHLFKLPILPIAVGLYLPITLSTPIFVGGLLRWFLSRKIEKSSEKSSEVIKNQEEKGILFASGMVAGEGIIGLFIAFLTVLGIDIALSPEPLGGSIISLLAFALLCWILARAVLNRKTGQ